MGGRYPCIDYNAKELTIANLHFPCVDMGSELPLGAHLRTELGEPGTLEKSQCVCAHSALGLGWVLQGRPCRVPNKSHVLTLASLIRRSEYQQALDFMAYCHLSTPKVSAE